MEIKGTREPPPLSPDDKLENEYIVALMTSDKLVPDFGYADYHFARQLSDGTWADKRGPLPSEWNEIDGCALAWDRADVAGYYNLGPVYFAVGG